MVSQKISTILSVVISPRPALLDFRILLCALVCFPQYSSYSDINFSDALSIRHDVGWIKKVVIIKSDALPSA